MKIYHSVSNFNEVSQDNYGLVIGNFDGLHLGHKYLLKNFKKECDKRNLIPVIITFEPHPNLFFSTSKEGIIINTFKEKTLRLERLGFEHIICLRFDERLQTLSAKNFIDAFLLKLNNLQLIFLGHDFSLGEGKKDSRKLLEEKIDATNIELIQSKPFKVNDMTCSSTVIRTCLNTGDVLAANKFLGRSYMLSGEVVNGEGLGKKEFVPTANIKVDKALLLPKIGVYFTSVKIKNEIFPSITNIGHRPSVSDSEEITIETHILDLERNLYGEQISVLFHERCRAERRFESKEDLLEQIKRDIVKRRNFDD